MVCTTLIRERVSIVHCTFINESIRSIDGLITFPPIDSNRVILPHEDALVLSLGVGGFDICRILVDPGNSANLLQISTYRQMGYFLSALENLGCVLSIFNKATTISLGNVVLPVHAGPTTLNVHFFVVDDLSPYNAIMGQIWLHKIKVILSTYH